MLVKNVYRIKYWFFAFMLVFLSACGGETAPPASGNNPSLSLSLPTNSVTLNEDFSTYSLNTSATDVEDGVLLVTISGQDTTLLTVDVTTHQITLTSIANANGISTFTVNVTDSDNLSATTEVVVTVNAINDTPVLTLSTTNLTLNEDFSTFSFNTPATDVEDGALLVTVSGQDTALLTVDFTTNQITLTSIANANGISTLTVNVTDSDNLSASTEVVVTVNAINDTPTLTLSTTNLTLNEDFSTFSFNTSATDVEDGTLLVTVSGQYSTLLTVDVTTHQITLTSIANANGISTLTINVTDSDNLSATTEVVVTINATPVLTLSTTNLTLNEDFSTFSFNTSATDVEDGALLVTISGQYTSLLTVDVTTNQITLTSIANANGISTLTVNVTDSDNLSVTAEVVVTINAINDTPVLTLSTTNLTLNEDFSTFSFNTSATDVEDGALLVTVSGQDTTLLTVDVTANQITLTSIANANGISTLTVNATDSDNLSATTEVVVTINAINDTPVLTLSTTNLTLNEDFSTFSFNTSATDAEEGALLVTISGQDTSLLTVDATTNQITLTSIANANGISTFTVNVTDSDNLSATAKVVVTVNPINDTPVLTLSTTNLTLNEDFSTFSFNTSATDAEEGALLVTISGQDTTLLTVDATTNQITLTSIANANGISTLTVNVTDSDNLSATTEVVVTINAINDTPVLTLSTTNLTLNEDFSTFSFNTSATDAEEGALLVTISGQYTSLLTVDATTNQITLTSIANANGISTFTVNVTDSDNLSATTEVVVTINPINDTPTLTLSTTNLTLNEDFSTFSFNTSATDAEEGALLVTVSGQYTSLLTVDATTNQITLTSIANANGISTLTVNVTDSDNLSVTAEVVVTINPINDTPVLTLSTTNLTLNEDFSTFSFNTSATDVEEGALLVTVSGQDTTLLTVDVTTNQITLTSIANANGISTLTVNVTDSDNLSASTEVVVTINAINDTPVLTLSTTNLTLNEDFSTFSFNTSATDVEEGALLVTVSGQDTALLTVDVTTNQITLTSIANANGISTLTVNVTDSDNLSASTAVVVTINPINDTPTLSLSNTNFILDPNTSGTLTAFGVDIDSTSLTYSVQQSTSILQINIQGNVIVFGTTSTLGFTTLVVTVTDEGGLSASATATVSILSNLLNITLGLKQISFSWSAVPQANHYRLLTNLDLNAGGGFVDASTAGLTFTPNSTNITNTTTTAAVNVVNYLSTVNGPQYLLQLCTSTDNSLCSNAAPQRTQSNTQLNGLIGYFKASNTDSDDIFGEAVSISSDGNTLVVGAPLEDGNAVGINGDETNNSTSNSGAAYVFVRSATGTWSQQAYIKASNTGEGDAFGEAVSVSGDGNTLVVGARFEDSNAIGINGDQNDNDTRNSGAVYVFVRSATGTWSQQTYVKAFNPDTVDRFGEAISVSGDGNTLVVGAPFEDSNAVGINGDETNNSTSDSGAAYVFVRSTTGTWSQQAYIKASNTGVDDAFGAEVSVSGDGNTLVVGARFEDSNAMGINGDQTDDSASNAGAAYVFVRSATGTWSQQAYIKASNTDANDRFGGAVSVSGDGNTLVVDARFEDSNAVGINGDQTNNSTSNSGAVYVFVRSTTGTWSQQAYVKASNTDTNDRFGRAVSVSGDGNTLVVGSRFEDSNAMSINGDQTDDSASNAGAAYVFVRSAAGIWSQQGYVKASNTDADDEFGEAVSVSGDGNTLVVGAELENSSAVGINGDQTNNSTVDAGAVYLY